MKIFEFFVKAFASLFESFAGGNRKPSHAGAEVPPSAPDGGG